MRPEDERYFDELETELDRAMAVANEARERGGDPTPEVEIPTARDMADRVENILGIDGVAERVRELEGEFSREEAALELVEDFVEGTVGDYESREGKIEGAVRTAVALLTEGVVAAPIEGIDRVELLENDDGTEFINIYYAGPIRSAGGTAQALSVLVADYARTLLDIDEYKPRDDEINRYAEEVELYDSETGLQYAPKEKEAKFIASNMPIMLDGEATGDEEVSGFRDLERVDTNSARGGMCLVFGEGIALKAPKIQRYTRSLDEVEWPWLQDLIDGNYGDGDGDTDEETDAADESDDAEESEDEADEEETTDGPPRAEKSKKFLQDLIAGRPVFSHPSETGGFRLRYGRARNHGHATAGIHPATMHLVDDFLATGTQVKTERPGKAAGIVPVDSIEGPTVRLANGDVRQVNDADEALEIRNGVEKILDLGEYLVNYGEFVENNHPLAPASYVYEWWVQEFEQAGASVQAMRDDVAVDLEHPSPERALEWTEEYDVALHPEYTYLWHDVSVAEVDRLADAVADGEVALADGATRQPTAGSPDGEETLVIESDAEIRGVLEALLVEHTQQGDTVEIPVWRPLVRTLGFDETLERTWDLADLSAEAREYADGENAIKAINEVAPFEVRERAPTRIGNRMGRPEKSEERELSPAVHTLFPIGEAGGSQRAVGDAATHGDSVEGTQGDVEVEVGRRECVDCSRRTHRPRCPDCGGVAEAVYICPDCESRVEPDESGRAECDRCETLASPTQTKTLDIHEELDAALETVGERPSAYDKLKAVKGLSSKEKTPEPLEKGILRAKHDVSAFKDGTVRYDMTDLPVTAVRPSELDVTVEDLQELGYTEDIRGDPLRHEDQLVELKVQDVVLSDGAAEHMLRTADFVDDLLEQYYGLEPYYEFEDRQDLVGELVFGMAPHTSAATVGRVIGFTSAAVGYAHPYFHAAKRRNCFHPETKIWYEDEDGNRHHERIESVVEDRLTDPEPDDVGTLVQELETPLSVPSVTDDGAQASAQIEAVSKHPAPEHMVAIETRGGRSLTVTPDHELIRYADGPERVKATEIAAGDTVPSPKEISYDGDPYELDLLAAFIDADSIPNEDLMIRGLGSERIKQLFREHTPGEGYVGPCADQFGVSTSTVYNWVSRDSVPAARLLDLVSREELVETLPDDLTLAVRRDTAEIDRRFSIDEEFATLLGYYAAEGFTRREKGSFYQTTICVPDEPARELVTETFDDQLGVDAYEENEWKITASSRLVGTLFTDVLELGARAETKRIPEPLFSGPKPQLQKFLSGYFTGDGSTAADRIEVRAHTVSTELESDLRGALKRFGIAAKTYTERRTYDSGAIAEFYDGDPTFETQVLKITSENAARFASRIGFDLPRKQTQLEASLASTETRPQRLLGDGGDVWLDEVVSVEHVEPDISHTYCVTVEDTHALVANDIFSGQCDGDEDCVMLLLDGLLNFSESFLPDQRGGRMDAPLVMSSRIDPAEIDDEAHNVDIMRSYPREFYESTREMAETGEVEEIMTIAEETLDTDQQYTGFDHTHDTTDLAAGPDLSAYKTLGSMEEKMDAQLALSRKLRAVDESDVAERIIEFHFLPDLLGNLKAFSSQEFRCLDCGEKYRRAPLTGDCRECGGDINLTVHEGSVNKYMDTAIHVAEEFGADDYTKQRLQILEQRIERIFENDNNKQSGIADFM
ncbi:DNA polymerase II large subunit [Halovenus sp. WSH3]|uniref:DNA polymerase II large subunit n=1 Tax=Halovenus carboxidivorans TaxID=2692199 RepID=A0A6B0T6G6_9EURY|nr:DNA polymerase II large subunit [Halovenus carboxidivorans]MXR50470.1 DNA polymerase II large subunit [Halovenus carboxidivorans]